VLRQYADTFKADTSRWHRTVFALPLMVPPIVAGLLWRFLLPGGYNPTKLAKQLGATVTGCDTNIRGLHIFTFNELRRTEAWRQKLLATVTGKDGA
jgi:ABC-type Fe3+ transport system permease subunit